MSRISPESQLKFLLSCVRHSTNGRVDFAEVAKECDVVSKGAAAKRYERLLKANDISSSGDAAVPTSPKVNPSSSTKEKATDSSQKKPAAKKRKLDPESQILTDHPPKIPATSPLPKSGITEDSSMPGMTGSRYGVTPDVLHFTHGQGYPSAGPQGGIPRASDPRSANSSPRVTSQNHISHGIPMYATSNLPSVSPLIASDGFEVGDPVDHRQAGLDSLPAIPFPVNRPTSDFPRSSFSVPILREPRKPFQKKSSFSESNVRLTQPTFPHRSTRVGNPHLRQKIDHPMDLDEEGEDPVDSAVSGND